MSGNVWQWCQDSYKGDGAGARDWGVLRGGSWDTSFTDLGNEQGFFKEQGLDIEVTYTEGGARGDTSGNVTKLARLETGLEIKAPLYIQDGEKVKVFTETGEFAGRA